MLERKLLQYLKDWMILDHKKPLLLRGARQVGKSTLVDMLGAFYSNYIQLNLEKTADTAFFTAYGDDVKVIMNAICLDRNIDLKKGKTLLFIDEVQEVPKAISLLRYFYEELEGVDVITAGSLLEFALGDVPSFPVGRVEQLHIYPLDFEEFLLALGEHKSLELLQLIPIPDYANDKLMRLFQEYMMVGGMPEVVAAYVKSDKQVSTLSRVYASIWENYKADVEKYGKNSNEKKVLNHIISTAHTVRDRITFNGFGASVYGSREVSEAFQKLQKAGIFSLIYPTTEMAPPILSNLKRKPKLQFLDTGLLNYAGNLFQELLSVNDLNSLYRGYVLNHMVFQEVISRNQFASVNPNFWVRESNTANAEVDLVLPWKQFLIPVELKSGSKGSLKSLHEFMDRCNHHIAFRLLANKYSKELVTTKTGKEFTLINLPYYCIANIQKWIEYEVGDII